MGFLFSAFAFDPGSRMTGLWESGADLDTGERMVALASLVQFGPRQHGELEASFLGSHMPYHHGGFDGVGPDGQAFALMIQVAPAEVSDIVGGNPFWAMSDGLDRGLHYNWQAWVRQERGFTHDELLSIFSFEGVAREAVADWSLPDLMSGLLAQCCYVPLPQIVAGAATGCAFPELDHDCQHDVFRDVFARWMVGGLEPPAALEQRPIPAARYWKKKDLRERSTKKLRGLALRGQWDPKHVRALTRKELIRLLSTPDRRNARDAPCDDAADPWDTWW